MPAQWIARSGRLLRTSALALGAALLTGCASIGGLLAPPPGLDNAPAQVQACADWFAALDTATDSAGVRDASAARVAGFAHYRVDRFTAALREVAGSSGTAAQQAALVQRLRQTDLQARTIELANIGGSARTQLRPDALQHTQACSQTLAAYDSATPARLASLWPRLQVPDDYVTAYRVMGVYALSRVAFGAGVRKLEAERSAVMAQDSAPAPGAQRLRYALPESSAPALSAEALRRALTPAPDDPLQLPAPSPAALASLIAQFAPRLEIDTLTDDDKPGTLAWRTEAGNAPPTLALDTRAPALYQQVAYTRYQGRNLLQLVYTVWFAARPKEPGSTVDLLAGALDGLVWRVTLAPDGTPLVFDTIHPCGCYHQFFPTPAAQPRPAPEPGIEWAFVPHSLPALTAQQRVVLRMAPRTHYLDRVSVESATTTGGTALSLLPYDSLRALPLGSSAGSSTRSVFSPAGFIDGTDRAERYLFWPMGIARAGSMRQWGKQATAFVGRRHFDDALLLEQRFDFSPQHFTPKPADL